jgi:hypothetical protein
MLIKVQIFFIALMICANTLFASSYDDDILNMYAKLSPRIVLMSSIKEKLDNSLEICLLHEITDAQTASMLQEKIISTYKNDIKNYRLEIKKVLYSQLDECTKSHMLFLFTTNEIALKKSVEFSIEKKILTISYDSKLLENGVDMSLFIGRKVMPYINTSSMKRKEIELDNILLRVSKIYREAQK